VRVDALEILLERLAHKTFERDHDLLRHHRTGAKSCCDARN